MDIFTELADNGPSGCSRVVGVDSGKWGRFGGHLYATQCALVGWWHSLALKTNKKQNKLFIHQ